MTEQIQERLSASDYYQTEAYAQHDFIQLIDGELVLTMPPLVKHQRIVRLILTWLSRLSEKIGGEPFASPIEVYLDDANIYQPDVLYVAPNSQCEVQEKRLVGAPDLVVEVLSPSTAKYDRGHKSTAYERSGVREYWIVDPAHDVLEVFTLRDGRYTRLGVYAAADRFTSPVLAIEVAVSGIFGTPAS